MFRHLGQLIHPLDDISDAFAGDSLLVNAVDLRRIKNEK